MAIKEVFRKNYSNAAAINTTTLWHIRPSDEETRQYAPFNQVLIFNDSDEDVQVRFNGSESDYVIVYSKTTFGTTLDDGKNYYTVDIYNQSATNVAIGEIKVRVARIKDVPGAVV